VPSRSWHDGDGSDSTALYTASGPLGFDYPAYGAGALSDVLPAIGAALGVREPDGAADPDPWGLDPVRRVCVFLVDGMGRELIAAHPRQAPYLSALLTGQGELIGPGGTGRTITAGFPTTTSTSLSSLAVGTPPGTHGMLGYRLRVPGTERLMNFLKWDQDVDPLTWQPRETRFERFARAGIAVSHVSAPRFADSGLTRSVFRGARFRGVDARDQRAARALEALSEGDRSFVYLYYSDLDFVGHGMGVDSDAWREQLGYVDTMVQWLAARLPADAALFVTADHGMVDIPQDRRIDVDTDWELRAGVSLLGGEARARHVYARPGAERDVLAIWSERLEGVAVVRSRDEAVAEGWFGQQVDPHMARRIGDVVVAMRDNWSVIATEREPVESRLVGKHGSMTAGEQLVPLLEVRGR
jgi:Type I phosphodiesterase / nucleotide pyrophosphatase